MKPANSKPHYEPTPHQQNAKRTVPVKSALPKKSTVDPTSIISGTELQALRSMNRNIPIEFVEEPLAQTEQIDISRI